MANSIEIRIKRLSDKAITEKWIALCRELKPDRFYFQLAGTIFCDGSTPENIEGNGDFSILQKFAEIDGFNLSATLTKLSHSVSLNREGTFDKLTISFPQNQKGTLETTANITQVLRDYFESIDLDSSLMELFDDDLKRYYQQREAGIIRLEQLSEKLINNNEQYRQKMDIEADEFKQAVKKEYQNKEEALNEREKKLNEQEEEMELADSKSARRKMRQDLLSKLSPSGKGVLEKQVVWPIHGIFVSVSLALVVTIFIIVNAEGFNPLELVSAVKFTLPSIGLIGTLMLYYRWMDAWIRKDVDEALRMKQLSIDVDRSTWVVEMLSELKEETAQIPDEVLSAVTRNLFTGRGTTEAVSHPGEDVVAALLGSSRSVEIDFPRGKINTSGKAIQKSGKISSNE